MLIMDYCFVSVQFCSGTDWPIDALNITANQSSYPVAANAQRHTLL
jgi:hypothetical protein